MQNTQNHHIKTKILIGILIALVVFLGYLFWRQYQDIKNLRFARPHIPLTIHHKGPLTIDDVAYIQSWMTFDYINISFGIPTDYIKTSFAITDQQYPQLSLYRYAKNSKVDVEIVVDKVRESVRKYFESK